MPRPAQRNDAVSSLRRGLSLLELFADPEAELSISEMARRSGIPKSTTHRLVLDLVQWGALEKGRRGLRLGVRLFEFGSLVTTSHQLRDIALPYAHNLNEVTHLTCNLAVREGEEILYIEKINTRTLRVPHSRLGGRARMHATALGKAILAFSDSAFVDSILSHPLAAQTTHTITDPLRLRQELARIRTEQVAYDAEESHPGLFCVAAPFFGTQRRVAGSISVTGATELARAERYAPAVRATAMALSNALREGRRRH